MIPYDLDPSLHGGEPAEPMLDDGFSPPAGEPPVRAVSGVPDGAAPADSDTAAAAQAA